jgi:hypothetical protein
MKLRFGVEVDKVKNPKKLGLELSECTYSDGSGVGDWVTKRRKGSIKKQCLKDKKRTVSISVVRMSRPLNGPTNTAALKSRPLLHHFSPHARRPTKTACNPF